MKETYYLPAISSYRWPPPILKSIDDVLKVTGSLKFPMHFSTGAILKITLRCQGRPMEYNLLRTELLEKNYRTNLWEIVFWVPVWNTSWLWCPWHGAHYISSHSGSNQLEINLLERNLQVLDVVSKAWAQSLSEQCPQGSGKSYKALEMRRCMRQNLSYRQPSLQWFTSFFSSQPALSTGSINAL